MHILKQLAVVALITVMSFESSSAAKAASPAEGLNTANAVEFDVDHPNSFRHFAPELAETMTRVPELDSQTGLYVEEVKSGLFYVTDGIYQSAFLATESGIIIFDAPPSFSERLPGVISQHAPDQAIEYLVYSHGHNDHVGGASVFADIPGLKIVSSAEVALGIEESGRPGIIPPTILFDDEYDFNLGQQSVELKTASFHSEHGDVITYLPKLKFLIAVDTITPGEVPFMNFGATSDIGGYLKMFDTILSYDFDHIMSGHISILGTRNDVILARDYSFDVRDTVLNVMNTIFDRFGTAFAEMEYQNGDLAYRAAMESVREECSVAIIDKWKDKLSVVDVWADSHCETIVIHSVMH